MLNIRKMATIWSECTDKTIWCIFAETPEFQMHLDSLYKWSATNLAERDSFARSIYRYSKKLLSPNEQVRFKNYRSDLFEDLQMSAELAAKLQATDGLVRHGL